MVVFGIVHTISCLLCTLSFLCIANSFVHRPSQRTIINNQHCRQPCCSISLSYKHPLTNAHSTLSHNKASKNSFTFPHSIKLIYTDGNPLDEKEKERVLELIQGAISFNSKNISYFHTIQKIFIETILNGYSNRIYKVNFSNKHSQINKKKKKNHRIEEQTPTMVVKIFSDTAKLRLLDLDMGLVDEIASHILVGPKLLFRNEHGIVMEFLNGRVLTEKDVHTHNHHFQTTLDQQNIVCVSLARKVALLHKQKLPKNTTTTQPNMLWFTLDKMLASIKSHSTLFPEFNYDLVQKDVQHMTTVLNELDLPIVLAHGDLKPSNVMLLNNNNNNNNDLTFQMKAHTQWNDIMLIDFELGGYGYRGFDLCKIFRTKDEVSNKENQKIFIQNYIQTFHDIQNDSCKKTENDDIEIVWRETRLFEPLTWLEAAIFFAFLIQRDNTIRDEWQQLSIDRLEKYFEIREEFQERVDDYIQYTQRYHKAALK